MSNITTNRKSGCTRLERDYADGRKDVQERYVSERSDRRERECELCIFSHLYTSIHTI